jgi:hypothetical protein
MSKNTKGKVLSLDFDTLYQQYVRPFFEKVPETRRGKNIKISLADTLSSCFAMFSLKCSSLLNFEERTSRESSNLGEVYRIDRIPSDSGMRDILDKVGTDNLHTVFANLFKGFKRTGKLDAYRWLQGRLIVSIDGTGFFGSQKISCPYCTVKKSSKGKTDHAHSLLSAVITCPGKKEVFPLASEPISRQDGDRKNDCELNASKRLLKRITDLYPKEKLLLVEDALYANAPHIERLLEAGMDYLIAVKPDGNKSLFAQFAGRRTRGELKSKKMVLADGTQQVFHYANNLRLNSSHPVRCNMLILEETTKKGVIKRFSWVSNIKLTTNNVVAIMKAGRARWKVENETFNTLKNLDYGLEHSYGHGKQYLANNFAILMMLAFLVDQIQQAWSKKFRACWQAVKTKVKLWEVIRSIFRLKNINSMQDCLLIILAEYQVKLE